MYDLVAFLKNILDCPVTTVYFHELTNIHFLKTSSEEINICQFKKVEKKQKRLTLDSNGPSHYYETRTLLLRYSCTAERCFEGNMFASVSGNGYEFFHKDF